MADGIIAPCSAAALNGTEPRPAPDRTPFLLSPAKRYSRRQPAWQGGRQCPPMPELTCTASAPS